MDSLKRKNDNEGSSTSDKKVKKEACPHAEKCYRRNPHHFKEYEHEYLQMYVMGDISEFPEPFTQSKSIYLEQIEIMKGLQKLNIKKPVEADKLAEAKKAKLELSSDLNILEKAFGSPKITAKTLAKAINSVNASASSSRINSPQKKEKKTSFVPNSLKVASKSNLKCNTMKEKLEYAAPYNIFFTKVPEALATLDAKNGVSFPDLICPSLGKLKSSLQINFMIDISWLIEQYDVHKLGKLPMTILHGYEFPGMDKYIDKICPNVTSHMVSMKDPFGCHHSKIGIYEYEDDTIRIVVSTANLYFEDWNLYNQGLWMSPALPKMPENKQEYECAGPTCFKTSLSTYLNSYELPILRDWIKLVKKADFSAVKVFFVSSTPGKQFPRDAGCHLHRVGDLLTRHVFIPPKTTPQSEGPLAWGVIAQSSSLGSFGKNAGDWLRTTLLRSLASHKNAPLPSNSQANLSIIYPSGSNVMHSLWGQNGGGCLPYSKTVNDKQKWLQDYLHHWKADKLGRSRAMPHIKSYCRVSPCLSKLAYYLLTSANISKSAWGGNIQKDTASHVRSYEAGVLFIPSFFDEEFFIISKDDGNDDDKLFPFIYDLPLTPYTSKDEAWCN